MGYNIREVLELYGDGLTLGQLGEKLPWGVAYGWAPGPLISAYGADEPVASFTHGGRFEPLLAQPDVFLRLLWFVEAINRCGGLTRDGDGEIIPVGVRWPDLAESYLEACATLRCIPVVDFDLEALCEPCND